jgi:serine phosphatase RsbU (regulator of sigma subunit)
MQKQTVKLPQRHYTTIALAEDVELARDYVEMLRNNEIPARFHINNELIDGSRAVIVVPEEFIERAQCLLQARSMGPDFYDYIYGDDLTDNNDETEE